MDCVIPSMQVCVECWGPSTLLIRLCEQHSQRKKKQGRQLPQETPLQFQVLVRPTGSDVERASLVSIPFHVDLLVLFLVARLPFKPWLRQSVLST